MNEKELSGTLLLDRVFPGAQGHFCRRSVGVLYGFDTVRHILLQEPAKDFRIKIRDCAQDEEHLHPGNGNQGVEGLDRQRMDKAKDKKDTDIPVELLPSIIGSAG